MQDETRKWMQELVDIAVRGTGNAGVSEDALIEARPEWALPNRLLVGKVREQMNPRAFHWFICGEIPLDYIPGETATTPRDALRYFGMKWQLDAERTDDEESAKALIDNAESIYELADDERFWQS